MSDKIEENYEFLSKLTVSECSCGKCVDMCKSRVCWGTPKDIQTLIESFPEAKNKLMIDWWVGDDNDIEIISPAFIGHEMGMAPSWPVGRCAFLTNDNKCEIHALKPTEGKTASCKGGESSYPVHKAIAMTWDSDDGRALVKEMRKAWW